MWGLVTCISTTTIATRLRYIEMSLLMMSVELADEIIKIFSDKLILRDENNIHYYPYSVFKGYDIYDIENALKLLTAYRVYNSAKLNEQKLSEFKKYASEDGGAVFTFFRAFIPNNIYKQLIKFPYGSAEYRQKEFELLYDEEMPKEMRKFFSMESETVESFLDFCLQLDRTNSNYWPTVYSRLNLIYNQGEITVKYLKFLTQNSLNPFGDYFQTDFTFIIKESLYQQNSSDIKNISVKLSGREDASLRANYDNYEIESAFFTIAKNYIIGKIEAGKDIEIKEEVFPNAPNLLHLDSEPLEEFHTEEIKIATN